MKTIPLLVAVAFALLTACGGGSTPAPLGAGNEAHLGYPLGLDGYLVGGTPVSIRPSIQPPGRALSSFAFDGVVRPPASVQINADTGEITLDRTQPLAPDDYAVLARDPSGAAVRATLHLAVYPPPDATFSVAPSLHLRVTDFFDEDTNWPTDQAEFGVCETASNSSMIGYAYYRNTNKVSPLYTLLLASDEPWTFIGNKGGYPADLYLWYGPDLGMLWNFFRNVGFVTYPGVPDASSSSLFTELYASYNPDDAKNPAPPITDIPKSPRWSDFKGQYDQARRDGRVVVTLEDVRAQRTPIKPDADGNKTQPIKDALDAGNLVLIMFRTFSYPDSQVYFAYTGPDVGPVTMPAGMKDNIWSMGRGGVPGGDHWVYIFAYGTAKDGSGSTVFFVRNSWGSKNGENGNYYMMDSFIEGQYVNPKTGKVEAIVQSPTALKIQVPQD
jgi:hypothetical protein